MAVLATETVSTTAGREGKSTSADGKINLQISPPGSNGPGTNPEQLFGAGYSACFGSAIVGQVTTAASCADTIWEITAKAKDNVTSAETTVRQGVSMRVSVTEAISSCGGP